MVALALFQALADAHPWDVEARNHALRDSVVAASSSYIVPDDHVVPFWKRGAPSIRRRPIEQGDDANLWTWLDWMLSASSNAAGSTVMAQIAAIKHFGAGVSAARSRSSRTFVVGAPPSTMASLVHAGLLEGLRKNGIDSSKLRQGSPFTRSGQGAHSRHDRAARRRRASW